MSQSDVEKATGILRFHTSRLENGHDAPSLKTLEKYAAAFGVPLWQLFYEGEEPQPSRNMTPHKALQELAGQRGKKGSEARFLLKLKGVLSKIEEPDRELFLAMVRKLAATKE
jgi:transcriptional regulator with XRE-family HTH domain